MTDAEHYGLREVTSREQQSAVDRELSANARCALAHIKGPTITGRFANRLYDMSQPAWRGALEELRAAGHRIEWVSGRVADDPTVTGGYVLREPASRERAAVGVDRRFAERRGSFALSATTGGRSLERRASTGRWVGSCASTGPRTESGRCRQVRPRGVCGRRWSATTAWGWSCDSA